LLIIIFTKFHRSYCKLQNEAQLLAAELCCILQKKSKYNHTLFKTPKNNNNKKAPVGAFFKD